jgi:hypothetical protein
LAGRKSYPLIPFGFADAKECLLIDQTLRATESGYPATLTFHSEGHSPFGLRLVTSIFCQRRCCLAHCLVPAVLIAGLASPFIAFA